MEQNIILIRSVDDVIEIKKTVADDIKEDIAASLYGLTRVYSQYAYDLNSGDILFAIFEGALNISLEAARKFYNIKQFYFEDKENENKYKSYFYDSQTNDIISCIDENNNLQVKGNVIYDSLLKK